MYEHRKPRTARATAAGPRTARRTTGGLATIVRLATEHGVTANRCLAGTGLTEADLSDPEREIEAAQEIHAVANLLDRCDAPGLGLVAGTRLHFAAYGVWGLGLISCPTVRDAAAFALRYVDLTYAMGDVRIETDDVEYRVVLDVGRLPRKVRTFFLERDMVSMLTLQREVMFTTVAPRRLHFTHPAPPYADRYRVIFGMDPVFSARRNLIALDAALLDRPLPMADEHTVRRSERMLRGLIARRRGSGGPVVGPGGAADSGRTAVPGRVPGSGRPVGLGGTTHPGGTAYPGGTAAHGGLVGPGGTASPGGTAVPGSSADFSSRVRAELLRTPNAGLDEIAARLAVSQRTVRRRLADEGTGFRRLLEEVRAGQAEWLLAEGMHIKDIAERLGYSEPAAFIHAFQRWKGVPPGRYRRDSR